MRHNPIPSNYVPVDLAGDLYAAQALDAVDDAIIDLLNASQALIEQRPLYVGKHLMDAAYRLNKYQELAGNDPLILELAIKLRDLALYEGYQDFESIRDRFLSIVETLRPWVLQQVYFRRLLRPERKLDKIIRFLGGLMTERDKTTSDLAQEIHRILKRGRREES